MASEVCGTWEPDDGTGPTGQCDLPKGHKGNHRRWLAGARAHAYWEPYLDYRAEIASLRERLVVMTDAADTHERISREMADRMEAAEAQVRELVAALEEIAAAESGAYTQDYQPEVDRLANIARAALAAHKTLEQA